MSTHLTKQPISLGLWVYIMSDCVLFASLFATYAVLHLETAGGAGAMDLFNRSFVLTETLILLASSFTCGLAVLLSRNKHVAGMTAALFATFVLGLTFLAMEYREFASLIAEGHGWQASAFLSSYFTLVGTHGLHILIGLLWIVVLFAHLSMHGGSEKMTRRIFYFSLFWHFLDIVWIFIFSFVYLFGTLSL
jgi:cytochrome o ubiquinol oxidase subunit 3